MKTMKKLWLLAAVLALVLALTACAGRAGRDGSAAHPTAGPTAGGSGVSTREPAPAGTPAASPGANGTGMPGGEGPDQSAGPDMSPAPGMSGSPIASGDPLGTPGMTVPGLDFGSIDDFTEGRVLDPSEIPEVAEALGRQFPEHTIQSVTEELYHGLNAYRITLQGDGELARLVYVLGDGTILIPGGMGD